MPNILDAFPSKYLKAADLDGREIRVTMERIEMETIGDDEKPVLYFKGKNKGVVLNKTNSNNIGMVYGFDYDFWPGQPVVLYESMTDFQGKTTPCIRIKTPPRKGAVAAKAKLTPPKWTPSKEYIAAQAESENPGEGMTTEEALNDEVPF